MHTPDPSVIAEQKDEAPAESGPRADESVVPAVLPDVVGVADEAAPTVDAVPVPATRTYTLHPRALDLWFWQTLLFCSMLGVPSLVISILAANLAFVLAPLPLLAVPLIQRYSRAYAARFRCELLSDGLLIDRGVFWRSETFVPRARIQHTDVNQGPISRRFGIATLKVFTAGTHLGEIAVSGLAHADALALRDELLGRHGHDAV